MTNLFYNPQPIDPNAPFPENEVFVDFMCFDVRVSELLELLPHPCLATLGERTRCAPLPPRANDATGFSRRLCRQRGQRAQDHGSCAHAGDLRARAIRKPLAWRDGGPDLRRVYQARADAGLARQMPQRSAGKPACERRAPNAPNTDLH